MFSRRFLLKSTPLAGLALVRLPRYVQGPEGLALPQTKIDNLLPQPLVIATELPLTRVEVSKGYVESIDLHRYPERLFNMDGSTAYIEGQRECKVVMYLTQIGNLQELMGKEVILYVEGQPLGS